METGDEMEVVNYIACPVLKYGTPATTYTIVEYPEDPGSGIWIIRGENGDFGEIFLFNNYSFVYPMNSDFSFLCR